MRLAGTCSRYSNRAIAQLIRAAIHHGLDARLLRWLYHATLMKMFDSASKATVCSAIGMRNIHFNQNWRQTFPCGNILG
jgi:hypothetical protein